MKHEVEAGTNVLKPGDVWGGSDKTNPSYFAPAYYKAFQQYTEDARWGLVADKAYEVLDKAANPRTGLVPNWVKADGTPLDDRQYGYDAMRTPWRICLDAVWNDDPRAIAFLTKLDAFFKSVGVQNIQDKCNLDGSNPGGTYHNAAGVAMAATTAIVDSDSGYRQSFWKETLSSTFAVIPWLGAAGGGCTPGRSTAALRGPDKTTTR
jgi:endo-1,4-beta-D-glucanase Y